MHSDHDTASTPFLPILNQPTQFHSSRDPGKCTLTPKQCAYKNSYWVFWYKADLVYCLPVVYFFVAAIALFAFGRLVSDFSPISVTSSQIWRRSVSASRLLSYKRWRFGNWNSQSLGVFLLAALGIVFFSALTLGPQPYYWPTDAKYGNSPPIATRTGWMALACVPFVIAFGTKANVVSVLTDIPPEKLILWHNWVSWAMFVLALVHTFPFIVYHNYIGDTAVTWQTGGVWLTGVVAIIAQAWLTFMSVSWIRNKWYEFFKFAHYFFAVTFMVFFFLHCSFRMTSWDYFIASGAIYFACLFYAMGKTYLKYGIKQTARLHLDSPHSLRITISTKSSWEPGQHAYLRFLTGRLHAMTSHPLTMCSVPSSAAQDNEMVFYVQPRGGLTRRLASVAEKHPDSSIRVLLEGPYGGLPKRWYRGFDHTLLIAGGSGCAFTLSLVEDWLRRHEPDSGHQLKVVLATRDPEMRIWYIEELQRMAERQRAAALAEIPSLSIHIYQTFHSATAANGSAARSYKVPSSSSAEEKGRVESKTESSADSTISLFGMKFFRGRPDTGAAVRDISLSESSGTVGVAVCGPSGMVYDVSCEAATQQQRIVCGHSGASEVWLHQEAFS
ncbi:hypothetical protein QQS21_010263 [Conoideocrella luteorostrata]|uniref:ferric-chelate reductase (NADPH) n=1 Tax=Conoideocrella luteorostrata TaxID=1105319 RepID=A0AAJ0CFL5_9HYPO|nr:hypothetical protein QQS21_010263 [Conoideocrella luteorostrata]